MATRLYLRESSPADTHLGTNNANIRGTSVGWIGQALATTAGASSTASDSTATVAGTTPGVEITVGGIVQEWISPPVSADVTISGTITANIWAAESNMSANVAINVYIEIIRANTLTIDSNTILEIVRSTRTTEVAVTTPAVNNFTTGMTSGAYTSRTLNRGDRLRIRVFGDDAGTMASGFTFAIKYGGPTGGADGDTWVEFTEDIRFETAGLSERVVQDTGVATLQVGNTSANTNLAQSFVQTATGITTLDLFIGKTGAPADNMTIELQADSSGAPSGSALASTSVSGASLSTTVAYRRVSLTYAAVTGTTYWIVTGRSGSVDASNYYLWARSAANPYSGGLVAVWNGSTWDTSTFAASDMRFIVYGDPPTTIYLTNVQSGLSGAPALISDFTGADENPLSEGGNWANLNTSLNPLQRISNSAAASGAGTCRSYWTPGNFGPDLEAYVTISTISGSPGISFRIQGEGGAGTWDGYEVTAFTTLTVIAVVTNNSPTTLATASTTWSSGDKLGIRIEGSTIQVWRQASGSSDWNLVLTAVDTTYASAGKVALRCPDTTVRLDDFYAATDSNLFTQKAWTSRGAGVVSYLSDTDAGWVAPLYTQEWYTPQLSAVTLQGMAQANLRALESAVAANASLRCEIAVVDSDGSNPTVWATWCISENNTRVGELNTSESAETGNISGDSLAVSDGQRLRIRLYLEDMPTTAMGSGQTVTFYYNGTSAAASGDSYITFPVTLTEFVAAAAPPRHGFVSHGSTALLMRGIRRAWHRLFIPDWEGARI